MRTLTLLACGGAVAAVLAAVACATTVAPSASTSGPSLADREAIEATLYRYVRGLDRMDPELYASAFAPDGQFDLGANTVTGREEAGSYTHLRSPRDRTRSGMREGR